MTRLITPTASYIPSQPTAGIWRRLRRWAACREYAFRDEWRVAGSVERVSELFLDTARIPCWWPQLFGVRMLTDGDHVGQQRAFRSRVKGFLPYELEVGFRIVEVQFPWRFRVELLGDLQGSGGGDLRQVGDETSIDLHLTIRVARPLLQVLSFLVRPLLRAQHAWVMRQGELGLRRALAGAGRTTGSSAAETTMPPAFTFNA